MHTSEKQGPLVVKIGGRAIDQPRENAGLWRALMELHREHPVGVVVVHGGGGAVDAHLDRLGFKSERREGLRITPEDVMPEVTAVLAGSVNKSLAGALLAVGAPAVGVCLGDGGMTVCEKDASLGFDAGRVGRVTGGDGKLASLLVGAGYLPVVACIGLDASGAALNVNADDAATALARVIGAEAVVLLTDVPGVLDATGELTDELDTDEIEHWIGLGVIKDGMIVKARAAARAAAEVDRPVVIASWREPERLAALAHSGDAGTRIVPRRRG